MGILVIRRQAILFFEGRHSFVSRFIVGFLNEIIHGLIVQIKCTIPYIGQKIMIFWGIYDIREGLSTLIFLENCYYHAQ
jgi:hypothetical protein